MKEKLASICYIAAKVIYGIAVIAVLTFFIALACKNKYIHIFAILAIASGLAGILMAILENIVGIFVISKAELHAIRKRKKKQLQGKKQEHLSTKREK